MSKVSKPCRGIGFEVVRGRFGVERGAASFHVGHLPQAADQAADVEAVGERDAGRGLHGASHFFAGGVIDVARDGADLAEDAARAHQQHEADGDADQHDLQGGGARLRFGRHDGGDQRGGGGPDRPDQHRAQDRAAVVAGAADDQHGPDLEGEHRHVVLGRDEADEMRLHRARQPHDGAADGEGLQAEGEGVLAERQGGLLVLADGAQHAAPGAAQQALEREIDAERRRPRRWPRLSRPKVSRSSASQPKGRGMKPMPKGPPVSGSRLSAQSCTTTATPKVAMAR